MNNLKIIIKGIYTKGLQSLFNTIKEQFVVVCIIVITVTCLCANPKTAYISWILIGLFAIITAIKALIEILKELKNIRTSNNELKEEALLNIGGKIFDFLLSVIGILQARKIIHNSVKIIKSSSSALSVVDDVAEIVSKLFKDIFGK